MLTISVSVGDAIATVEFDAGHWAPDIANDMVRRAVEAAVMANRLHRADTEAEADE